MNIKNKKTQFGAGVAALIVILAIIFLTQSGNGSDFEIIKYKDPKLTDSEKQVFIDRIEGLEEDLKETKDSQQKYAYQLNIASNYGVLGEYEKARKVLLSLTRSYPDNFIAWGDLSVIEMFMQDYDRAEDHTKKAISLNPNNVQYWTQLVNVSKGPLAKSREEVQKIFEDALKATNNNADILALNARYAEEQGDLVAALNLWREALGKNPANKVVYETEISRIQNMVK